MTPPVSPAASVHRGSVINQGPMAGRPLTSCSFSSSSCLSSLSVMTQPSPCPSYPETLYHCLPQTSTSYYPPVSSSAAPTCQAALRSGSLTAQSVCCLCLHHSGTRDGTFILFFRSQVQNQCLTPVQSQTSPLGCHLLRYPSISEQPLSKDVFYNPHSSGSDCSLTPYGSTSSYAPSSDPVQTEPGLDQQSAAHLLDSAEGFGFVGTGLNLVGGCQGQTYSVTGGKKGPIL